MVDRSGEIEFRLYRREGGALVEAVAQFKYLGRPLYQMYDDQPELRRKLKRAQRVWVDWARC